MKIEMLNVGWLTSPAGIWRRDDPLDKPIRFPIPSYLIESDRERILIDTGLHPALARSPAEHYGIPDALATFGFELQASIAEQVDLETITRVVLTHLHFDHSSALSLLPDSVPVILQRAEWEAAHDPVSIERNFYMPADYAPVADRVVLLDGDHDLLGDGSVRLLSTPGHTPGHQSVMVEERVVIGGDVSHFSTGFDDHRFPMFADDFAAQTASAERLRALRDAGMIVRPGHDPEVLIPGPVG